MLKAKIISVSSTILWIENTKTYWTINTNISLPNLSIDNWHRFVKENIWWRFVYHSMRDTIYYPVITEVPLVLVNICSIMVIVQMTCVVKFWNKTILSTYCNIIINYQREKQTLRSNDFRQTLIWFSFCYNKLLQLNY